MKNKFIAFITYTLATILYPSIGCADWLFDDNLSNTLNHSVLTDTFGIDLSRDLYRWSNLYPAAPYLPKHYNSNYYLNSHYFQCFESSRVFTYCEQSDDDASTEYGGYPYLVIIAVLGTDHFTEKYISRRALPYENCKSLEQDLQALVKKDHYSCLGGISTESESLIDENARIWIWDRLTNRMGSMGWWDEA